MNILAISTLFPSENMPNHGVFVFNRLNSMAKLEGVNVTVLTPRPTSVFHKMIPKYKEQQKKISTELENNFKAIIRQDYFAIPGLFKSTEHYFLFMSAIKKIEELHKIEKFDHIDIHWSYPDLPLGIELAKRLGVTCTLTLRGMETFYLDENDARSTIISKMISDCDGVISLSEEMLSMAKSISKVNRHNVILNGVDTANFYYTEKDEARKTLDLELNDFIMLGVGSLIKRKGFHHVIASLKKLSEKYPERNFKYLIIGSLGLEGVFEKTYKMAEKLNNELHNVTIDFVGQKPNKQLPLWYASADIFCLSSFGEGSPNVLSEALACGCPVITTDVGSASDLLSNAGKNAGFLIPNQKDRNTSLAAETWFDEISKAVEFDFDRELISKKMKKYTWKRCAKESIKFIKSLG